MGTRAESGDGLPTPEYLLRMEETPSIRAGNRRGRERIGCPGRMRLLDMQLVSMVSRHETVQDSVQDRAFEEGLRAYGTRSRRLQMIGNDHPEPLRFKFKWKSSSSGFDAIRLTIAATGWP